MQALARETSLCSAEAEGSKYCLGDGMYHGCGSAIIGRYLGTRVYHISSDTGSPRPLEVPHAIYGSSPPRTGK